MAQKEGINTPLVVTLALVSASFIVVVVFGVQAWFNYEVYNEGQDMWAEYDKSAGNLSLYARDHQNKEIRTTHWVDKDKGVVAIPIESAMQKVVDSGGKVPWKTN